MLGRAPGLGHRPADHGAVPRAGQARAGHGQPEEQGVLHLRPVLVLHDQRPRLSQHASQDTHTGHGGARAPALRLQPHHLQDGRHDGHYFLEYIRQPNAYVCAVPDKPLRFPWTLSAVFTSVSAVPDKPYGFCGR